MVVASSGLASVLRWGVERGAEMKSYRSSDRRCFVAVCGLFTGPPLRRDAVCIDERQARPAGFDDRFEQGGLSGAVRASDDVEYQVAVIIQ